MIFWKRFCARWRWARVASTNPKKVLSKAVVKPKIVPKERRPWAKNWKLHRAKSTFLGQKLFFFSKSGQIDPKVSPISQKRFAVYKTAMLSSIRKQSLSESCAKSAFFGSNIDFFKSAQIDPKVLPMSQKRFAVCETTILSFIRGQTVTETTPSQNWNFEDFWWCSVKNQLFRKVSRSIWKCHQWVRNVSQCAKQRF